MDRCPDSAVRAVPAPDAPFMLSRTEARCSGVNYTFVKILRRERQKFTTGSGIQWIMKRKARLAALGLKAKRAKPAALDDMQSDGVALAPLGQAA